MEVGKCIVEPIKLQFNYLCCFNTNIQNLRDEAKRLEDAKAVIQMKVEEAKRNTELILPRVETWLECVKKIQEDYRSEIELNILNVKSGCFAIKSRFALNRRVAKMTEAMKELRDHGKFEQISHSAPPASMALSPLTQSQTDEFESRKQVENIIMSALREKKVNMIGIWGRGGVGKTAMAKKIMSRAWEEGLFDEIAWVVVSQQVDMFRIQLEMAELLGLRMDVESLTARAHMLRTRLINAKSLLIILDDLWEGLNLEDVGIPRGRESTILLTSRNRDVLRAMHVEKMYEVQKLLEPEAWSLFKENIGACANEERLIPIAKEIVQVCIDLPIALEIVGKGLRDEENIRSWEFALKELKSSDPKKEIPDSIKDVYTPLKIIYDILSEDAKFIFLLCCLFPKGKDISISSLSAYAWGLGMCGGMPTLHDARNKVQALVQMLINRSLLLRGISGSYVKMQGTIHDFASHIAAEKGLNRSGEESDNIIDCTWISLFDANKITLPGGSGFPNLPLLSINNGTHSKEFPFSGNFLENTRKLNVLSIGHCVLKSHLPHTTHLLKSLKTLIFESCEYLEDISIVGELAASLEILICRDCGSIKELPVEIGGLNQLKLLHISDCERLKTIAAGVISRLIRLEELTLIRSFKKWQEGENPALHELNTLHSLTTLRIEIEDASLVAEDIHLSSNLVAFDVRIGNPTTSFHTSTRYGREMQLVVKRDVIPRYWIRQLVSNTESLVLQGEGSSKLVVPEFHSLKRLIIQNAKMTRLSDGTTCVFPVLESLCLKDIDDLQEIHNGPISSHSFINLKQIVLVSLPKLQRLWNVAPGFRNLSSVHVVKCHSLRSLFSLAMAGNFLLRLTRIIIRSGSMMEQVVLRNEKENGQSSSRRMGKLQYLDLYDLSRFTSLYQGVDSIEFTFNCQKS